MWAALRKADARAQARPRGGRRRRPGGTTRALGPDEVEVRLVEKEGMAIHGDRDLLVALDVALTPDLITEGLARELVNRVQRARKEMELDYADRIAIRYRADDALATAIAAHGDWIRRETLATTLEVADGNAALDDLEIEGHTMELSVERD
ncbi:MAG: DUF5915 domain-containing protein [Thermoanaerobaculia bacterium]|nr:DUF5915 domain-containing protein [Thermoanaerobaculia bacterium]